jgi:hypothetical protein
MAAYNFPNLPTPGQKYPFPAEPGKTQYEWTGSVWNIVSPFVQIGDQEAYNNYLWPTYDGLPGTQLTSDGAGNLAWEAAASTTFALVSLNEAFDGVKTSFTLVNPGTTTPFVPTPPSNILVFLGGVPQIPNTAYTITGSTIQFTEAPLAGSTFYAISSKVT